MTPEEAFQKHLRNNDERISSARMAIFKVLLRKSPLSTTDLVETMQKYAVDQATTYRNLKLFRELGMVRDIGSGNRRMVELTDVYAAHHHHFWCRNCGKLVDFDDTKIEDEIHHMAKRLGITIMSHQIEISGLCKDCSAKVDHR